ncbi:MAG: SMI1/KNR4 family protein [Polyangiales bacterium]
MESPAGPADLAEVEDALVSPLPSDLRLLLSYGNGGRLPSGTLLRVGGAAEGSVLGALRALAERLGRTADDPELPVPYYLTHDGPLLAFDRGAGPIADTWPIVDASLDGELRLVHRTFDGWCRLCVLDWSAPDFDQPFSLQKYLATGLRHVEIESDVAAAHATVAHALRRLGEPERALASYLAAGRCVPPLGWCDFEALKIALLLGDSAAAMEVARRLCVRAPAAAWRARGSSPTQVADALGMLATEIEPPEPLLRLLDRLAAQAEGSEQGRHIGAIRRAVWSGEALPPTRPVRTTAVPAQGDIDAWWTALGQAYRAGKVRDEDLLLDPVYRSLRRQRSFAELLHTRRDFS